MSQIVFWQLLGKGLNNTSLDYYSINAHLPCDFLLSLWKSIMSVINSNLLPHFHIFWKSFQTVLNHWSQPWKYKWESSSSLLKKTLIIRFLAITCSWKRQQGSMLKHIFVKLYLKFKTKNKRKVKEKRKKVVNWASLIFLNKYYGSFITGAVATNSGLRGQVQIGTFFVS